MNDHRSIESGLTTNLHLVPLPLWEEKLADDRLIKDTLTDAINVRVILLQEEMLYLGSELIRFSITHYANDVNRLVSRHHL